MTRKLVAASPRSGVEIDGIAMSIVKKFQPEALKEPMPFDIERFFECEMEKITGVKSDYKKLPPEIYGYTDSRAMESVISSDLMDDSFQVLFARSTMSHETGHCLIHVPEFRRKRAILKSIHDDCHSDALRMYRETEIPVYMNPEWQAWRFAGALLMPRSAIEIGINRGGAVQDLSRWFQVNPAFIRTRLKALKIEL